MQEKLEKVFSDELRVRGSRKKKNHKFLASSLT